MDKEFVPYEEALVLKELGFDESCLATYTNRYKFGLESPRAISQHEGSSITGDRNSNFKSVEFEYSTTPLYQQVFRWFREKYILYHHIFSKQNGTFVWCIRWYIDGLQKDTPYEHSNTYEEAELACLKKLIEIVKKK